MPILEKITNKFNNKRVRRAEFASWRYSFARGFLTACFHRHQREPIMPETTPLDKILSKKVVIEQTSIPRGTLDHWISKGLFPPPIALGPCRIGWKASVIQTWIDSRPIANRVLPTNPVAPIQADSPPIRRRGRPRKTVAATGDR